MPSVFSQHITITCRSCGEAVNKVAPVETVPEPGLGTVLGLLEVLSKHAAKCPNPPPHIDEVPLGDLFDGLEHISLAVRL